MKIVQEEKILSMNEYRGMYRLRPIVSDNGTLKNVDDIFTIIKYI